MKPGTLVQHIDTGRLAVVCCNHIMVVDDPNVVLVQWVHSSAYDFGFIEDFDVEISTDHIFMSC